MTNGKKIKAVFPSMKVGFITDSQIGIYFVKNQNSAVVFNLDWWNAEYKEPTTKTNSADKCIDSWDINGKEAEAWIVNDRLQIRNRGTIHNIDLPSVTSQEPMDKCKWIKYDHRTMCPKEHIDIDSPYWRIPENRMETLKYCPYCGKEIEVEE